MADPLSLPSLADTAPTGSLFFHAGRNPQSQVIKVAEVSPWSHVGMIVRPEDIGHDADGPWLWEATDRSNLTDVLRSTQGTGTQVVDLLERIRTDQTSGHVSRQAVRLYQGSLSETVRTRLRDVIDERSGIAFPDLVELATGYALHLLDEDASPEMTVCTQLTADTLQKMGWIETDDPPNGYGLSDFEPGAMLQRDACGDASWGPMMPIEWVADDASD